MHRILFGLRGRSAVSTMIGGIIVLTLLLTALGTMVFVSQQYDSYQGVVNQMSQIDINRFSENLGGNGGNTGAVYPGLTYLGVSSSTSCGGHCQKYNLTVSNLGIGTQIARVYINSTSDLCATTSGGCILDPVSSSANCANTCFRISDRYVNPGEYSHGVLLWLAQQLPYNGYGLNTISIATTRGRVFSFQWPFPPVGQALPSGVSISTGVMKVAYNGGGFNSATDSTHPENRITINAGSYGSLAFVNPWVTNTIFEDAFPSSGTNHTTFYVFATFTNTNPAAISVTAGNLLVQVASSTSNSKVNFVGGTLIGDYYGGVWYGSGGQPMSSLMVGPTTSVILIFRMNQWVTASCMGGVAFTGSASISNGNPANYFGGTILLDGLYVAPGC